MKIAAVIAEYNPFHTGHRHHIERTREITGADCVVAIMGGNFTQRGESAILEKQYRAQAALNSGVDIVVELPGLFTVRNAQVFADAGVAIAHGMGADVLSFGCETDDMDYLYRILEAEKACDAELRAALAEGKSYARARGEAVAQRLGLTPEELNRPNLTLALEYIRALQKRDSAVQPMAVQRVGEYHSGDMDVVFPSASAIRAAARDGQDVYGFLPGLPAGAQFMRSMEELDAVYMYAIRNMQPETMANVCDANEGIEYRVCKLSTQCTGRMQLLDALKCKRYTMAHLSRLLTQAVCGVTRQLAQAHPEPEYIRVLGMRKSAGAALKEISRRASLPIVSDGAQLRGNAVFECECRMTDLFMLLAPEADMRVAGVEYTRRFISVQA